jgi:hypothetical protein
MGDQCGVNLAVRERGNASPVVEEESVRECRRRRWRIQAISEVERLLGQCFCLQSAPCHRGLVPAAGMPLAAEALAKAETALAVEALAEAGMDLAAGALVKAGTDLAAEVSAKEEPALAAEVSAKEEPALAAEGLPTAGLVLEEQEGLRVEAVRKESAWVS